MVLFDRPRRWPGCAVAVLFLGYAAGKAAFAAQSRLGFPGGPPVSAAEKEHYFLDAATAQWMATATGLLGACMALATVTSLGRRLPRKAMLAGLAVMLAAVGAGAVIMAVDGFVGMGVGWRWYHGILGIVAAGLVAAMTRSFVVVTRRAGV
ncbi:hypothetical protein [Actinoallomurus soli]|uniref:hypothetical protein n=1 Tax=Actinoallomurus soli TaxID=2952535 RepID=UPI0020938E20|nr:hypothetical protein [Actinoallomurus soli]MCO5968714.1 hypothetical protein [Actinoallomurus soli]